ncbi:LOW QUALITY PROTEIN: hypothetical protein YC2023_051654 [Brassica napus]
MNLHPVHPTDHFVTKNEWKKSSFFMFYSLISSHSFSKKALTRSPVTNGNSTPKRFFKRSFRHPSLAKRIIARRHGSVKP